MKIYHYLLIIIVLFSCKNVEKNESINEPLSTLNKSFESVVNEERTNAFFAMFPEFSLPLNMRKFNKLPDHWETKYYKIPSDTSLKYFFNNDTSKFKYHYEIYSNDDNSITESGIAEHAFYAFEKFKYEEITGLIYYKSSPGNEYFENFQDGFYLSLFDSNQREIERILVEDEEWNEEVGEHLLYRFSVINQNLDIDQFCYDRNIKKYLSLLDNNLIDKENLQSIIIYKKYQLQENRKFLLKETRYFPGKYESYDYQWNEKDDDIAKTIYKAR